MNEGGAGEAGQLQIDTHLQFEDGERSPYVLSNDILNLPVSQAKKAIFRDGIKQDLDLQGVHPNDLNLIMSLIMPPKNNREAFTEMVMKDDVQLTEYVDEITSCDAVKLRRKL